MGWVSVRMERVPGGIGPGPAITGTGKKDAISRKHRGTTNRDLFFIIVRFKDEKIENNENKNENMAEVLLLKVKADNNINEKQFAIILSALEFIKTKVELSKANAAAHNHLLCKTNCLFFIRKTAIKIILKIKKLMPAFCSKNK